MGKIVAIGGGDFALGETLPIDQDVVRLTGKWRPSVLFVPTASNDSEAYFETFREIYGGTLGCRISVLRVLGRKPPIRELEASVLSQDVVYVGGGNTLKMMRRWRYIGLDSVLRRAYDRGIVLAGISAGAICWFDYGHSDSYRFYHPEDWQFIRVRGLGLVKGTMCPHYDEAIDGAVTREELFQEMMERYGSVGIGVENNCAVRIVDGKWDVLRSKACAKAYRVYRVEGRIVSEEV